MNNAIIKFVLLHYILESLAPNIILTINNLISMYEVVFRFKIEILYTAFMSLAI